ncbi:MAG: hypothetical protein DDT25_00013 [Chloroflexi bacterium]|nr:hypothetical protein [Chloroflexota bacterium]
MSTIRTLAGHSDGLPASLEGNPNLEPGRLPYVPVDWETVLEEPGRRVVSPSGPLNRFAYNFAIGLRSGVYAIFMKTGSGQEEVWLPYGDAAIEVLMSMHSDQRFVMLLTMHCVREDGIIAGRNAANAAMKVAA